MSLNEPKWPFSAYIDRNQFLVQSQFYWPKVTKTTFLGQVRPKQVFPAKIDQNQIVQAEKQKNKNSQIETGKG